MLAMGVWRTCAPALVLLASLGLAGCGSDDGETPAATTASETSDAPTSTEPSEQSEPGEDSSSAKPENEKTVPPGTAKCSEVWSEGASLPRFYPGCAEGDVYVVREGMSCSSGQRIVVYDDRFYAVLGGTIDRVSSPLDKDPTYQASVRRCRA